MCSILPLNFFWSQDTYDTYFRTSIMSFLLKKDFDGQTLIKTHIKTTVKHPPITRIYNLVVAFFNETGMCDYKDKHQGYLETKVQGTHKTRGHLCPLSHLKSSRIYISFLVSLIYCLNK